MVMLVAPVAARESSTAKNASAKCAEDSPSVADKGCATTLAVAQVAVDVAARVADRVSVKVAESVAARVVTPIADHVAESVADSIDDRLQDALDAAQDKIATKAEKQEQKQEGVTPATPPAKRLQKDEEKIQRQEERARERALREIERKQRSGDNLSRLYDQGRAALDDDRYERAEAKFDELVQSNGPETDAALYWKAYAENRLGKRDAALAAIGDLKQRFPQSRWQKDAAALEIEVRQSSGQAPRPEAQSDEELRMLALNGLVRSDPERAIPVLGKVLDSSASPKEKERALFVLAQSGSQQGREIIVKIARGQGNPDLQRKAIQYLGLFGGEQARQTMAEVYASSSTDALVKRAILRSYMVAGDKERLFQAAKIEKDDELKLEAVRQLGVMHAQNELQELYRTDSSPEVRRELLQAFFLAGNSSKLLEVAQSDPDKELRRRAVRNLGLIHSDDAAKALQSIYAKESDRSVKEEVLQALFLQGNAAGIVAIVRNEKDPELKKAAVSKLSVMRSKEATDYLMELLQK
jgi:TolA-binding protein